LSVLFRLTRKRSLIPSRALKPHFLQLYAFNVVFANQLNWIKQVPQDESFLICLCRVSHFLNLVFVVKDDAVLMNEFCLSQIGSRVDTEVSMHLSLALIVHRVQIFISHGIQLNPRNARHLPDLLDCERSLYDASAPNHLYGADLTLL